MLSTSTFTSQVVGIVDASSSGVYLPAAFLSAGYRCVHISSGRETFPGPYAVPLELFVEDIHHEGSFDELLGKLSRYRFAHVLAGSEPGVELADQLSSALRLPTGNGTALSDARRNKHAMQERLAMCGVPHPVSKPVTGAQEALAVAREVGWPLVVKPVRSCGTDHVRICHDEGAVRTACDGIFNERNILGVQNDAILAQEFLAGDEYMINSASADGEHRITEIWRSRKFFVAGAPLYDELDLVSPRTVEFEVLSDYTSAVLDALGVRWGPAHSEVMLDGRKPRLIEAATRLQGNINPAALMRITGSNQILDAVASYITPERFLERTRALQPLKEQCKLVLLRSPASGRLVRPLPVERIAALPSFHSLRLRQGTVGMRVQRTVDLFSSVGSVYLIAKDREQLARDCAAIRDLEAVDFYAAIEPDAVADAEAAR